MLQYNGLLSGLLLLSISSLASHSVLLAGLLFSGLLMFKVRMMLELIRTQYVTLQHIYLYIAPAYGISSESNKMQQSEPRNCFQNTDEKQEAFFLKHQNECLLISIFEVIDDLN